MVFILNISFNGEGSHLTGGRRLKKRDTIHYPRRCALRVIQKMRQTFGCFCEEKRPHMQGTSSIFRVGIILLWCMLPHIFWRALRDTMCRVTKIQRKERGAIRFCSWFPSTQKTKNELKTQLRNVPKRKLFFLTIFPQHENQKRIKTQ